MTGIAPNTRVIHRQHPEFGFGAVRYVEEDALGDVRLQVEFDHVDGLENVACDEVQPVGDPLEDAAAGRWGGIETCRRKLAVGQVIAENNLTGGFTKAAVQPLPHQAFLLDKILSGNRFGHVLADDVGLGKTIEAGLLITCLLRRDPPQRILIVCPTGLALQWQDEMDEHFGLTFAIMGENFDGKLMSSWRTQSLVIAPLDRLKRPEYHDLLRQIGGFDLVVCDEAHRLTAQRRFLSNKLEKTANYRLFELLVHDRLIRHVDNNDRTPRSPRLLLLSATPHQGDDERFVHLLSLARPDLFSTESRVADQLKPAALIETLTRTPKSRAVAWDGKPLFKGHETVTIDTGWTVAETDVSRLLTDYILKSLDFARSSDRATQLVVQLVMHTFHKIAASSWAALRHALERRLAILNGQAAKLSALLATAHESADDSELPEDFVLPARAFFENEKRMLEELVRRLGALGCDSKWERSAELLRQIEATEPGVKLLVFTQYRITQDLLRDRLNAMFPTDTVETICGDMAMRDRQEARFRFEQASRFLVSTEAGGEGVNLQRACHVMLNYDLPWNPMRLQQRIGRLDRYGQRRKVNVFNLRVPDSWDNQISARILQRLDTIQRTMALAGPGTLEDYREMLLGQIAEQVDAGRLFAEAQAGQVVSDAEVDGWIRVAVESVERWRGLLGDELGLTDGASRLKPRLTSEDLKIAYRAACEHSGIRLRESRNSAKQFVPGVFSLELPDAFRDPVFRPSRTTHVVFDRDVYAEVRGQTLGMVRGQPIRPALAGFGEPFTDWIFQMVMQARAGESAFAVRAGEVWTHGSGWLLVFALRWIGSVRRLSTPDGIVACFAPDQGAVWRLDAPEASRLLSQAETWVAPVLSMVSAEKALAARQMAQQELRERVACRDTAARGVPGLSLLMAVAVSHHQAI
jgi:superfamily II DNA or RNA helicase